MEKNLVSEEWWKKLDEEWQEAIKKFLGIKWHPAQVDFEKLAPKPWFVSSRGDIITCSKPWFVSPRNK